MVKERESNNNKINADEIAFDTDVVGNLSSKNDIDVFKIYVDASMILSFYLDPYIPSTANSWDVVIKNDGGDIMTGKNDMNPSRADRDGEYLQFNTNEPGWYYIYVSQDTSSKVKKDADYSFSIKSYPGYFLREIENNNSFEDSQKLKYEDNALKGITNQVSISGDPPNFIRGQLYLVNSSEFSKNYDKDFYRFNLENQYDTIKLTFYTPYDHWNNSGDVFDSDGDEWIIKFYHASDLNNVVAERTFVAQDETGGSYEFSVKKAGNYYIKIYQDKFNLVDTSQYKFALSFSSSGNIIVEDEDPFDGPNIYIPTKDTGNTPVNGKQGNDTYILSMDIERNAKITISDKIGENKIQLVDGFSFVSSKFYSNILELNLTNNRKIIIENADLFSYDIGGNITSGVTGEILSYLNFAKVLGITLPSGNSSKDGSGAIVSGTNFKDIVSTNDTNSPSGEVNYTDKSIIFFTDKFVDAFNNAKWNYGKDTVTITYSFPLDIVRYNSEISREFTNSEKNAAKEAISLWDNELETIDFKFVENSKNADLTFGIYNIDGAGRNNFNTLGDNLNSTSSLRLISKSQIRIDSYDIDDTSTLKRVILHEVGHSLGLGHFNSSDSGEFKSIMFPRISESGYSESGNLTLSSFDKAMIKSYYREDTIETYSGSISDDIIALTSGNDEWTLGPGFDQIDGGSGVDTAIIPNDALIIRSKDVNGSDYYTGIKGKNFLYIALRDKDGNEIKEYSSLWNFEKIQYRDITYDIESFDDNGYWNVSGLNIDNQTVINNSNKTVDLSEYFWTRNESGNLTYFISSTNDNLKDQILLDGSILTLTSGNEGSSLSSDITITVKDNSDLSVKDDTAITRTFTVTMKDINNNVFTLEAGANSVAEGSSLTYTVNASSAPAADVTLSYNVTGDTKGSTVDAAGSSDVVSLSGTVVLAAGTTSVTFTIDINSDEVVEGLEGMKITVFDGDLNAIGSHVALISNVAGVVSNTVAMATTSDNIDAGSGDDVISGLVQGDGAAGTTLQPGDVIVGGAGSDNLKISVAGDQGADGFTVSAVETSGVETITVNNFDTGSGATTFDLSLIDFDTLTTLALGASNITGDTTFTNVAKVVDLEVSNGTGNAVITYTAAATAGTADNQLITLKNVADSGNTMTVTTPGVENVTVQSNGLSNTLRNLTTTGAKTITVQGDGKFTVETALEGGAGTIDLAGLTANANIVLGRDADKTLSVTGGDGNDVFTYADDAWNTLNTLNGGPGNDTIVLADAADLTVLTAPGATSIEVLGASAVDSTGYFFDLIPSVVSVASYAGGDNTTASTIFSNMPSDSTLLVAGNATDAEGAVLNLTQDSASDTLTVNLAALASGAGQTTEEILADEYETITLNSLAGTLQTIELLDSSQMSSLVLTDAAGGIKVTFDANSVNFTSIDATGSTLFTMGNNPSTKAGGVTIDATPGIDTLIGGTQGDTISGNAGNDIINGAAGADTLNGGSGVDRIEGDGGIDTINAGDGNDSIMVEVAADFISLTTPEVVDGGEGTDTLSFGSAGTVAFTVAATDMYKTKGVEKIVFADNANASLTLDNEFFTYGGITSVIVDDTDVRGTYTVSGANLLAANSIDVRTSGGAIVDTITGGAGDDSATFDTTAATGLQATDTFDGNGGTDTLNINLTVNNLTAVTLTLVSDIEKINITGSGAYTAGITLADGNFVTQTVGGVLYAVEGMIDGSGMVGSGALTVVGTAEDDSKLNITGGRGGDILTGGTKADTITGGFGADTITGGPGIDILTGGPGNDIFSVGTAANALALTSAEVISGGDGSDTLLIDVDAGSATIAADLSNMTSIETINLNGTGADSITLSDSIFASNGVPTLKVFDGQAGDTFGVSAGGLAAGNNVQVFVASATDAVQTVTTGAGNDAVFFWNGVTTGTGSGFDDADTINLGAGTDTIAVYLSGNANHSATYTNVKNIENLTFALISGNSTVSATLDDANFVSVAGTVTAAGVTGATTINAVAENDSGLTIIGGNGVDTITGTDTLAIGDTINGGLGADIIDGSLGGDTITGGAGNDVFKYAVVGDSTGSAPDSITDFISAADSFNIVLDYSTNNSGIVVDADVTAAKAGSAAVEASLTGNRGQVVYDTTNNQMIVNVDANNLVTALDYKIGVNPGATATTTIVDSDITWDITGGAGGDIISTTSTKDVTIAGGAGNDSITDSSGNGTLSTTSGTTTIIGNDGGDQIDAGAGITTIRYDSADDGGDAIVITAINSNADDFATTTFAAGVLVDQNDFVTGFTPNTDFIKIGGTLKAALEASGAVTLTSGTDKTTLDFNATGILVIDNGDQVLIADGTAAFLDISDVALSFNTEVAIAQNGAGGDEILFTIENNAHTQTGLYYLKFGATNNSGQIAATDTLALLAVFADDDLIAADISVT